jgi:hypothetical protein
MTARRVEAPFEHVGRDVDGPGYQTIGGALAIGADVHKAEPIGHFGKRLLRGQAPQPAACLHQKLLDGVRSAITLTS